MSDHPPSVRNDALVAFFALTFAITWGLGLLVALFPGPVEALLGPLSGSHPLFVLAVAGPTLAATILTAAREGRAGLRALYARLFRWRCGPRYYALVLVGIPLVGFMAGRIAGAQPRHDLDTPALVFGLLLNQLILGPLGEELGWRGFALPRLLRRCTPLAASLVLGALWGVWHLPAFFLSGLPQAGLALPAFLFGVLCLSIIATWLFDRTGGSVLIVALWHLMVNVAQDVFRVPLPAATVALAVAAALVLLLGRRSGWFVRMEPRAQPAAASACPSRSRGRGRQNGRPRPLAYARHAGSGPCPVASGRQSRTARTQARTCWLPPCRPAPARPTPCPGSGCGHPGGSGASVDGGTRGAAQAHMAYPATPPPARLQHLS